MAVVQAELAERPRGVASWASSMTSLLAGKAAGKWAQFQFERSDARFLLSSFAISVVLDTVGSQI